MSERYNMVVPYGDDLTSLDEAIRQLPVDKVIAFVPSDADSRVMAKVESFLSRRGVKFEAHTVSGESANSFFQTLSKLKSTLGGNNLIVNVSAGTLRYSYLLLCAAMATGVMAFGVFDGEVTFLPISCSITHGT